MCLMMNKLFIPEKLKVGFQERPDTFTGKLGFVTYLKDDNTLFYEKSWKDWCRHPDKLEINNTPSKFVINKGINRNGYFGNGHSLIRMYDMRGFEIEITVENLIGILMQSDVSKRDIEVECVYAWNNRRLVLLPINSKEYFEYSAPIKREYNVKTSELIRGYTYINKSGKKFVYLGRYDYYDTYLYNISVRQTYKGKKHIFKGEYGFYTNVSNISLYSTEIDENFANVVEDFEESVYHQKIVRFYLSSINESSSTYYSLTTTGMVKYVISKSYNKLYIPYVAYISEYFVLHDKDFEIINKPKNSFETDAIIRNMLQNNKNDYENVKSAFEQVGKKYTTLNLVLANNKTKEVML